MSGIRIPGCYTHPWLLYASLVVIRIPGRYAFHDRYTHPRPLYATLPVIRIPGCYTHPLVLYASLVVIRIPGSYKPP